MEEEEREGRGREKREREEGEGIGRGKREREEGERWDDFYKKK